MIRSLLYVGMASDAVDERGFEMVRRIRDGQSDMPSLPLPAFKALVRDQYFMLLIDPEASLAALPSMLPDDPEIRLKALDLVKQVLSARGEIAGDVAKRLHRIDRLFRADRDLVDVGIAPSLSPARKRESRKVS